MKVRLAGAALFLASVGVFGCQPEPAPIVKKGTPVRLALLSPLEAGRAKPGDVVRLYTLAPVADSSGSVVAEAGSEAQGEVVQSRGPDMLSSLANRPARLSIRLRWVLPQEGAAISLVTDPVQPDQPYSFTRDNTRPPQFVEALKGRWNDEATRIALEQLHKGLEEGKLEFDNEAQRMAAAEALRSLQLDRAAEALRTGKTEDLQSVLRSVREGRVGNLKVPDLLGQLRAAGDLLNLAFDVGDRIGRALRPRTIRAYAGTEVPATVATDSVR